MMTTVKQRISYPAVYSAIFFNFIPPSPGWSAGVAHQVILLLSVWLACIVLQIAHCEAALLLLLWGVSSFMLEHLQCCCWVIGTMFITCGGHEMKTNCIHFKDWAKLCPTNEHSSLRNGQGMLKLSLFIWLLLEFPLIIIYYTCYEMTAVK